MPVPHSLQTQLDTMIRENRQLVTNEPVEFENNQLMFKTAGKLPIILEEFCRRYPNLIKEDRIMSTCNRLDLHLNRLICPKISLITGSIMLWDFLCNEIQYNYDTEIPGWVMLEGDISCLGFRKYEFRMGFDWLFNLYIYIYRAMGFSC